MTRDIKIALAQILDNQRLIFNEMLDNVEKTGYKEEVKEGTREAILKNVLDTKTIRGELLSKKVQP